MAALIAKGIDHTLIYDRIHNTNTEDRLRLLGFCLSERMKTFPEYKTAYIALSQEDLDRFNYQKGDTEGVVNYPLSIDFVRFTVLIKEDQGEVKMSFRSSGNFSVNKLARKYFNGGGHENAAGGKSNKSLAETVKQLEALLPEYKEELLSDE